MSIKILLASKKTGDFFYLVKNNKKHYLFKTRKNSLKHSSTLQSLEFAIGAFLSSSEGVKVFANLNEGLKYSRSLFDQFGHPTFQIETI